MNKICLQNKGDHSMIRDFKDILNLAKTKEPKVISVAVAQDTDVLGAVKTAYEQGIIKGILVGNETEIRTMSESIGLDLADFQIINEIDPVEACRLAVEKVSLGEADLLMKGLVDSSVILKAVLNKEANLRTGRVLSHVGVISASTYERILIVSDAAINIAPDLETKRQIIENSVEVAHGIGIEHPNVALICAKEKVNPKMQATVDAKQLEEDHIKSNITSYSVGGPFAIDNAVSLKAAEHKGIDHPVAGKADVLIVPNIEAGNVLYKSLTFIGDAEAAGIIVGAKVPVIMTSRADSEATKLNSIALAMLTADRNNNRK